MAAWLDCRYNYITQAVLSSKIHAQSDTLSTSAWGGKLSIPDQLLSPLCPTVTWLVCKLLLHAGQPGILAEQPFGKLTFLRSSPSPGELWRCRARKCTLQCELVLLLPARSDTNTHPVSEASAVLLALLHYTFGLNAPLPSCPARPGALLQGICHRSF